MVKITHHPQDHGQSPSRAPIAFGTCLGNVLPEEKLVFAARWTGKGLRVAQRLDDPPLNAYALRMHGNELRKAGRRAAAVARLRHAVALTDHPVERGAALTLLARASGDHGNGELFNATIADLQRTLDAATEHTSLFNPFTIREVHIRGLLATSQDDRALRLVSTAESQPAVLAPQWTVIEHITMSEALLRTGEHVSCSRPPSRKPNGTIYLTSSNESSRSRPFVPASPRPPPTLQRPSNASTKR